MAGGAFKVFVALHVVDYASRHLMHFSNLATAAGRNTAKINKQLKIMGGLATMMVGGAAVGAMLKLASSSTQASRRVAQLRLEMEGLGLSTRQVKMAEEQSFRLGVRHPNMTTESGMHLFKDTYSVLGDYGETRHMMPFMTKFQLGMRGLYGNKGDDYAWDAVRAAELQMGQNFSGTSLKKYLDVYTHMAYGSGGKINPAEIHAFMKNTPYGRMSQTPEALYKQMMLMMEMGGGRAGTGLQAMDRFLIAKQARHGVSREKRELWQQYGLIENVQRNKRGSIVGFDAVQQDLYMKDKVKWMYDVFIPAMQKYKIDSNSPASIPKIAELFSSQTAAGALITTLLQQKRNLKEVKIAEGAFGVSKAWQAYTNSPVGINAAFFSSLEELLKVTGDALLPLIITLQKGAIPIIKWLTVLVKENPKIVQGLVMFITALGAAALAIGGIVTIVALWSVELPMAVAAIVAAIVGAVAGLGAALFLYVTDIPKMVSTTFEGIYKSIAYWLYKITAVQQLVLGNMLNNDAMKSRAAMYDWDADYIAGNKTLSYSDARNTAINVASGVLGAMGQKQTGPDNSVTINGVTIQGRDADILGEVFHRIVDGGQGITRSTSTGAPNAHTR